MQLARVNPTLPLRSFRPRLPIISTSNSSIPRKKTGERERGGGRSSFSSFFDSFSPLKKKEIRLDTAFNLENLKIKNFFPLLSFSFFFFSAAETKQRDKYNAFLSTRLDDVDTNFPISVTNRENIGFH